MPVLSIIACDMLEDELTYVLSKDNRLDQLILVEKRECFGLRRKLKSLGCLPVLAPLDRIPDILKGEKNQSFPAILKPFSGIRFIEKIRSELEKDHKKKVTVVANLLKKGLHMDSELLKTEVYKNIREMSGFSDRILIFYGTCGHSLVNIEKEFNANKCQLYFLKDDKGEIIEDCIGAALGGNDAYTKRLGEGEGTFYLTPMWASSVEEFKEERRPLLELARQYIRRYRRVAKINTGISYEPGFDEKVRDFALLSNSRIVEIQGSMNIAEQSYKNARNF